MHRIPFIAFVELRLERVKNLEEYPFNIPALQGLARDHLELDAGATFFVGEDGIGKSTLVEASAIAAGFNREGGSQNFTFGTRSSESELWGAIRLVRTHRRPSTGFFLRAESFFNVATNIEEMDRIPAPPSAPLIVDSYGGRSLHEQSHGESFMTLIKHRFRSKGLYILDEPEAALSARTQIELAVILHEHARTGSQLIVATHSPILLSVPGARIYQLSEAGISPVRFEEVENVALTRTFLSDPARFFREDSERN